MLAFFLFFVFISVTPKLGPELFGWIRNSTVLKVIERLVETEHWEKMQESRTFLVNCYQEGFKECIDLNKNGMHMIIGILTRNCRSEYIKDS